VHIAVKLSSRWTVSPLQHNSDFVVNSKNSLKKDWTEGHLEGRLGAGRALMPWRERALQRPMANAPISAFEG
jgi:hypothetical protein